MNNLLTMVAMLLTGGSFWLANGAARDLPERVDVDGRMLRMRTEGHGSPTVVLEIGLGGPLDEWELVQPEVAKLTRVVAYDRIGAVDTKLKLTGIDVCRELHAGLQKAGINPPYVLVGQSLGGVNNRLFASLYPDEVVGMVLLDPTQEEFIAWVRVHHPKRTLSKKVMTDWAEGAGIWDTMAQLKTVGPLPDVPIVVVTGAKFIDDPFMIERLPVWTAAHKHWVESLPQGRHVLAPNSGHGVQVEAPELVVEQIRNVIEQSHQASPAAGETLN